MDKRSMIYLVAGCILLVPYYVAAQIVPQTGLVPCTGLDCDACALVDLAQNILNFLIYIGVFLAVLAIAWAGFLMLTAGGDTGQIEKGRKTFTVVVIGFLLLLASWLLVNTFLEALTNQGIRGWTLFECSTVVPAPDVDDGVDDGDVVGTPSPPVSGDQLVHGDAERILNNAGIGVVSSGRCTDRTRSNCTSLDGVRASTIDAVVEVAGECSSCNIVVTAGTEIGHRNSCHVRGTCVDIDCAGDCSTSQINTVISTADAAGNRAVYEVLTAERKQQLINSGVSASDVAVIPWATGEHFSLYTDS